MHEQQIFDLLKIAVLIVSSLFVYHWVNTERIRDFVENQDYLKLHVFFTLLQVDLALFVIH